jgi:hypothetical protein
MSEMQDTFNEREPVRGRDSIIRSTMTRVYFICPKSRKEISATFDIPGDKKPGGSFEISCRHCGEIHPFRGSDVLRWIHSAKKKPRGTRL